CFVCVLIYVLLFFFVFFFFFQAEDGIRDDLVTGVQTCALPIYVRRGTTVRLPVDFDARSWHRKAPGSSCSCGVCRLLRSTWPLRSEERRVGKEGRVRRAAGDRTS